MRIVTDHKLYREWLPSEAGLYLQPEWLDIFNRDWNARIGISSTGDVLWMWPYRTSVRYGLTKFGRPVFCPDNAPLEMIRNTLHQFNPEIRRWFSVCEIDDRTGRMDHEAMINERWKSQERFYQYFDLTSYPYDFSAVSRSKRKRMIKKEHLEFCLLEDLSDAEELLLQFFRDSGFVHFEFRQLKRIRDQIKHNYDSWILGIRHPQGYLLAVQWLIGYGDVLYGWVVARNHSQGEKNAREMLVWHILQWARDRYKVYDLGGSSIPGVRQFNLEMGAQEKRYWRYQRFYPRWVGQLIP